MSESFASQRSDYDLRKEVSEKLRNIMASKSGTSFFEVVVRPNMLPEDVPSDLPQNVFWIGEKDRQSFVKSRAAMGDLLRQVIDFGDMDIRDAVVCAESLEVNCFYDTQILPFTTPFVSNVDLTKSSDNLATVHHMPKHVVPDPFGTTAEVFAFTAKESRTVQNFPVGHNADVISILPVEPDAIIYEFRNI